MKEERKHKKEDVLQHSPFEFVMNEAKKPQKLETVYDDFLMNQCQ